MEANKAYHLKVCIKGIHALKIVLILNGVIVYKVGGGDNRKYL